MSTQPGRKPVSQFSATEIGQGGGGDPFAFQKKHFREEAGRVSQFLQGVHPARKIGHMQVNYAESVNKLSKMQQEVAVVLKPQPASQTKMMSTNSAADSLKMSQVMDQMGKDVASERSRNYLKRTHNREVGRKAIVDEVMAGRAPIPKVELYPQGVTHTQMLAMTGTLAMPSPHTIPAPQPPRKKWMGEAIGWGETPR